MIAKLVGIAGWVLGALAAVGLVAYLVPGPVNVAIAAAAFSTHLMTLAPLSAVLLAAVRQWWSAALAVVLTVACILLVLPTYVGDGGGRRSGGTGVEVLTANLKLGQADPAGVVAAVRSSGAEVVLLQELTSQERDRLAAAGLDRLLPNTAIEAREDAAGVGLWSRYPLEDVEHHRGFVFAAVSARLDLGAARPSPTVLTVHMPGPFPQSSGAWKHDIARMPALLSDVAAQADRHDSTVLVGGDLNATWGNEQFRGLLTGGYHDAAEQFGAQWTTTYPSGYGIPPLLGIDHVLVRSAHATAVASVTIPGSDHRALRVHVVLGDR